MGTISKKIYWGIMFINPTLLHLWGPLSIHIYGVCIAIGVSIALWMISNDKKTLNLISYDNLTTSIQLMILSGYIGGRLFCMLNTLEFKQNYFLLLKFWEPGFSILGSIIGIIIITSIFLWIKHVPLLKFADRIAIYAPLVQSFGRLGCFFSGCCYGQQTTAFWAIIYQNQNHMAPINIPLHPTQLYSSITLLSIFLWLYLYAQKKIKQPGIIVCYYLMLISIERFVIDFWRWDRTWWSTTGYISYFSSNQWIACLLFLSAFSGVILLTIFKKKQTYGSV